jgi:lipoic acid synthetase
MDTKFKFKTKPDWLKINLDVNRNFQGVREIIQSKRLHTVCEEAKCPNIHECWGRGTTTFMILGDTCTRSCRFCAVKIGRPVDLDKDEPIRVAQSVQEMGLSHVVITSVNRDELPDGGAEIWANTIHKVREINPPTVIEVLTPDFKGIESQLNIVFNAKPDVYAHNLETVPSLYKKVRPQAKYSRSLSVLNKAKSFGLITKTGIMVGLGESLAEIIQLMRDAVEMGVDIFTVGQYLQPSKFHLPVNKYLKPAEFDHIKEIGLKNGFKYVEAGPLVRSSYHAEEQYEKMRMSKKNKSLN